MNRIPYGKETRFDMTDTPVCGDCHVALGELHDPGCDIEECPECNRQKISCGCENRRRIGATERALDGGVLELI